MGASGLGSRAIIGEFYNRLEQNVGATWVPRVSMMFNSDQAGEEYKWLGMAPAMREWIGGRHAKGFRENGIRIDNLHFEATMKVLVAEMRRDKTGQIMTRVREMADRTNSHWASLLSTLLLNGASAVCYDGQFFFDTDHQEGDSGVQSNSLTIDIATLPVTNKGSATAPSVAQMQLCILQAIEAMHGFLDDQGEPMNEGAEQFVVKVPTSLWSTAVSAVTMPVIDSGDSNVIPGAGMSIQVAANARLKPWTTEFAVCRADGNVSPFIRQEETPVELMAIAEGSEHEAVNQEHLYGVDTWRNVGYGYWQHAVKVTMTSS